MNKKPEQKPRTGRPAKSGKPKRAARTPRSTGGKARTAAAAGPKGTMTATHAARPAPELQGAQRKQLRALAHHLTPLVQVGHPGVTDSVAAATSRALLDHELIKVRLHEPEDKNGMALELAQRTQSALCGLVGHTVILYRPHPVHPTIQVQARRSTIGRGTSPRRALGDAR